MEFDVSFPSQDQTIAGTLFVPDGADTARAAVVISHPFSSVRQQSPANYARPLSADGFVVLTFDAAYQGESTGEPRQLEDPYHRAEDVKSAVSFLSARDEVDPDRIGVLGICASGGYVPFAAVTDQRMKAVATVSGADVGALYRAAGQGEQQIAQSNQARTDRARGQTVEPVGMLPASEQEAEGYPERSLFREAYDYYRTPRAQDDRAPNTVDPTSWDRILEFDAYEFVDRIAPRPLLMIAGSRADTLPHSRDAVERAGEPKELYLIDDASHVDLYDRDAAVGPAAEKLRDFFSRTLT